MDPGLANLVQGVNEIRISSDGRPSSRDYQFESAQYATQPQKSDVHSGDASRHGYKHVQGSYSMENSDSAIRQGMEVIWTGPNPTSSSRVTSIVHQGILPGIQDHAPQTGVPYDQPCSSRGNLPSFTGELVARNNTSISQVPFTSSRYLDDGEYDLGFTLPTHGVIEEPEGSEVGMFCSQELVLKIREQEDEITQLRKHITDYAMKEALIRNEKHLLEKKISYMRTAFENQQHDLVDATSKAITYRQEIIEDNIRLTYALHVAEQECTIYVTSLVSFLNEYRLQPHVDDAQSIITNIKFLILRLRERINLNENRLKESQYLHIPFGTGYGTNPSFPPQSLAHPKRAGLIPQQLNNQGISGNHQPEPDSGHVFEGTGYSHQGAPTLGTSAKNIVINVVSSHPPASHVAVPPLHQTVHYSKRTLSNSVSLSAIEPTTAHELPNGMPLHFPSSQAAITIPGTVDHTPLQRHGLPSVSEEPSSSCSEAEDDLLPAIEGLQILGEAFPGQEIKAYGYSVNGTTTCNIEWIREAEDGSVAYITGANNQPTYVVTADDVDSRLAIEIVPMDDQKRKGDLIKEFANDKRKITCGPKLQHEIEKILSEGHTSFQVSLSNGYMDIWESAVLNIKNRGYTIKSSERHGIIVSEKFSDNIRILVPYGHPTEFLIEGPSTPQLVLRTQDDLRDLIVLTLRLFQKRAAQLKRKGKKVLFFN